MAKKTKSSVTMRVRVGDSELEVTGPGDFVEKKINDFLKNRPAIRGGTSQPVTATVSPQETQLRRMSLAQLFKKCGPRTDNDRVLLAAYFREKLQNAENSTASEIRDVIRSARRPPPKNTSDAINQNIKKGLVMSAGDRENKMTFVVTTDGEEAVEEMLNQKNG